jgi:glyoxylase-like metal-dependent hydrolase (beta-lactamase superfamily II)
MRARDWLSSRSIGGRRCMLGLACACALAAPPRLTAQTATESVAVRVHRHVGSDADAFSNSYIVETPRGVIVVDAHLTSESGAAVRAKLDSLGVPLLAVLLTHAHPDHYGGIAEIVRGRQPVKIISTVAVDRAVRASDSTTDAAIRRAGIVWPTARVMPNMVMTTGQTVTLGGLRFTAVDIGTGESMADSYWLMDGAARGIFVGDLATRGMHAFTANGHTREWLATIDRLEPVARQAGTVYPGHGEPGGVELFDATRNYLRAFRRNVAELAGGATTLTVEAKAELARRMAALVPGDRLSRFVARGADAVAAELAGKR